MKGYQQATLHFYYRKKLSDWESTALGLVPSEVLAAQAVYGMKRLIQQICAVSLQQYQVMGKLHLNTCGVAAFPA